MDGKPAPGSVPDSRPPQGGETGDPQRLLSDDEILAQICTTGLWTGLRYTVSDFAVAFYVTILVTVASLSWCGSNSRTLVVMLLCLVYDIIWNRYRLPVCKQPDRYFDLMTTGRARRPAPSNRRTRIAYLHLAAIMALVGSCEPSTGTAARLAMGAGVLWLSLIVSEWYAFERGDRVVRTIHDVCKVSKDYPLAYARYRDRYLLMHDNVAGGGYSPNLLGHFSYFTLVLLSFGSFLVVGLIAAVVHFDDWKLVAFLLLVLPTFSVVLHLVTVQLRASELSKRYLAVVNQQGGRRGGT